MAQIRGRAPSRADDQGFTEILIVIALVAITAIGVISLFGEQIEELFSGKPPEASATTRQESQAARPAARPSSPAAAPAAGGSSSSAATSTR